MKKNLFQTVKFDTGNELNAAMPEQVVETGSAIEHDPEPPAMSEDWYKGLMTAIRRVGPLRESSLPVNDETNG